EPSQTFAITWGTWVYHATHGNLRLSLELATQAMELAERLSDPGILMEALFMPGATRFYRGDFAGARAYHARALTEYEDRARTKFWAEHTGQDAGVAHRGFFALALWHLRYPDQALEPGLQMRELAHPFTLAQVLCFSVSLYQDCGLGAETEAACIEQLRIAADEGFLWWHVTGMVFKAGGLLLQERANDALPLLRKALDAFRGTWA